MAINLVVVDKLRRSRVYMCLISLVIVYLGCEGTFNRACKLALGLVVNITWVYVFELIGYW